MPTKVGQALRRLRTPRWCAIVVAALIADGLWLAATFGHDTAVSGAFRRTFFRDRRAVRESKVSIFLVRGPNSSYTIIDDRDSAETLASLSQNSPERLVTILHAEGRWHRGAWAPWLRRDLNTLNLMELTGNQPLEDPREAAAARLVFSDWLESRGDTARAHRVRASDFNRSSFVWWGPVHDALGLAALLLVLSCVPLVPAWVRDRSVAARLNRRICPACGYDLHALPTANATARCPECGREWSLPS